MYQKFDTKRKVGNKMSVLERIQQDLDNGKEHIRRAGERAKEAKDYDGVIKIAKEIKRIDELKEDFSQKGR
jgi:uncharacterized protein (UPF0147 family)